VESVIHATDSTQELEGFGFEDETGRLIRRKSGLLESDSLLWGLEAGFARPGTNLKNWQNHVCLLSTVLMYMSKSVREEGKLSGTYRACVFAGY
jgi:hypothetical protein